MTIDERIKLDIVSLLNEINIPIRGKYILCSYALDIPKTVPHINGIEIIDNDTITPNNTVFQSLVPANDNIATRSKLIKILGMIGVSAIFGMSD